MSNHTTGTTNNHWRQFVYRDDVPAAVLADQFDWTDKDHTEHGDYSDGFFQYRGFWYHLGDFMRGGMTEDDQWQGHCGDSYFSGTLIEVSRDGEEYRIATYTS